jgi:hypothetical protein
LFFLKRLCIFVNKKEIPSRACRHGLTQRGPGEGEVRTGTIPAGRRRRIPAPHIRFPDPDGVSSCPEWFIAPRFRFRLAPDGVRSQSDETGRFRDRFDSVS